MSDFVKELNFDGDTFNDMKRDMNFVLQRLLGNMQEKECQEGTLTLKLDVSLVREYVPNYNPNIPGESREIAKPKFSHKVTSQMKVEDMKKGNLDTEMELFLKEGPLDGVYAETKGTYTKFKGTGAFQKEKRILHQKVTDVGIKASLQTGMVSINDRNRNQAIAVSITEMVAVLNEALRYGTAGKGKKVRL